jgi:hypothetical protein
MPKTYPLQVPETRQQQGFELSNLFFNLHYYLPLPPIHLTKDSIRKNGVKSHFKILLV